jgi:hypothetical protein
MTGELVFKTGTLLITIIDKWTIWGDQDVLIGRVLVLGIAYFVLYAKSTSTVQYTVRPN